MKNLRHFAVGSVLCLFGSSLLAAQPPDIGHFKGLAFSSATDRHPLEINGGTLAKCETDPASHSDFTTCEVEKGSVVVTGTESNNLTVKLVRVAILRTPDKTPARHYYYKGTADLMIGDQAVTADAHVTINIEDASNKVNGIIELPAQYAKSSFEAYLVP